MKNVYESLCAGLKIWPVFRRVCVAALLVSFGEMFILALIHQWTGNVPSVRNFSLLVWHWHLPFAVSRLWDILFLPAFVYLSFKNEVRREKSYFNLFLLFLGNNDDYDATIMDWTQVSLCAAMLGSSMFGIIYAMPFFTATYALQIMLLIAFAGIDVACESFRKLQKRRRAPKHALESKT